MLKPAGKGLFGPVTAPAAATLLLLGLAFIHLASWPIVAHDADTWLHLGLGRYIREHRALPVDSFFSFLRPTRLWLDYYWLFQVLVDRIFAWGGYHGLVALRAVLYLATSSLAAVLLLSPRPGAAPSGWGRAALAAILAAFLIPRFTLVRPHLFGYFFIAAFLYVLERRPDRAWLLPPLAALWCNIHGITYPFLWLIVGAYLAESGWTASGGLCLAAVLATPHGLSLLKVPFMSLGAAAQVTKELLPFQPGELLSFGLGHEFPSSTTLFAVILAAAIVAALRSLRHRPRLAPLLLFAGGLISLAKGRRFSYECALLALPLLSSFEFPPLAAVPQRLLRAAAIALLALASVFIQTTFAHRPRFPVSRNGLPAGVAAFLEKADVGGDVLNYPDTGSYLWHRLYPRYRIYLDMSMPTLFAPEDLESVRRAYSRRDALAETLGAYRPDFVCVPLRFGWMKQRMAEHPRYVLVFFDDVEALYVDRSRHPGIATAYALKALNPYALQVSGELALAGAGTELPAELTRLLSVDPGGQTTNQLAALFYLKQGAPGRALPHAEAILREYPEWPTGHALLAQIRRDMAK